jgi:hypothetical protein
MKNSPMAGDIAHCYRRHSACMMPWVQYLAPKSKKRKENPVDALSLSQGIKK